MTDTPASNTETGTPAPAPTDTPTPTPTATPLVCPPGYSPGWEGADHQPHGCVWNYGPPPGHGTFPPSIPTPTPTIAPTPTATAAPTTSPTAAPVAPTTTTATTVAVTPSGPQLADTGANIGGGLIVVAALVAAGVASLILGKLRARAPRK